LLSKWASPEKILYSQKIFRPQLKDANPDLMHCYQNGPVLKKSWTHILIFQRNVLFYLIHMEKRIASL